MAEDNVEKAKKPRKRGTRMRVTHTRHVVYENLNRPSHAPTPDLDPAPGEFDECAMPDETKAIEAAGNPFAFPGGRNPMDRVSPPLTAGHQAPSTGDHGAGVDPMNVPGPRELAFRHPDLRQSSTTVSPLAAMRTNYDEFPADLRGMTNGVPVALSRLDAAGATGVHAPPGNPVSRPLDHIARNSATPPTPGHSLSDPRSHAAPTATKGSDALRIMRETQNMGRR